ncbi:hypothetical protein [Streptomyces sp. NPDC050355]|uniref:hypothetical protein n=1 Tax=Streptomyces sp. NPDC050355 TaxID=3365609 RepID=UPI00379D8EEC
MPRKSEQPRESTFPLIFLRAGRYAAVMPATTATFHVVNARVMGPSRFVCAFLATYLAVSYAVHGSRPPAPQASTASRPASGEAAVTAQ